MLVTPTKRKVGKYKPGDSFDMPDRLAKAYLKAGHVTRADTYQTRMLQAQQPTIVVEEVDSEGKQWDASLHVATKIKNADGTWRKKPGRAAQE